MTQESASGLRPATTNEAKIRELMRAKIIANDLWSAHRMQNSTNDIEKRIDFEMESGRLWRAKIAAEDALSAALRLVKDVT